MRSGFNDFAGDEVLADQLRRGLLLASMIALIGMVACDGRKCPDLGTGPGPAAAPGPVGGPVTPARSEYAEANGLKMHYRRQGSGPVLVLLHGGSASAELCWGPAFSFFAPRFDVIAPDQMGHGRTADDPERPLEYHGMAEDTVALLGRLGVTSASFVGWSDGGNVALDIAMNHPALVKKLVASSANFAVDGLKPQLAVAIRQAKPEDHPQLIRDDYAKLSPDGAGHWPVFFGRLQKMWTNQPAWTPADLGRIKSPTLVIAADDDGIRTEHTVAMAAAIPGARLAIIPMASHFLPLEQADLWNATVLRFLDLPPPAPASGH